MSELRQDRTTGGWVIVAPERGRRLRQAFAEGSRSSSTARAATARHDPGCPFCPGNEAQLPGVIEDMPMDEPPGWRVRVVPNKYPAIGPDTSLADHQSDARHRIVCGHGAHEVVIESPWHDTDLSAMSDSEIAAVFSAYRRRFVELLARPGIAAVILFRNRGKASGASIAHPHAQLVALTMVPPWLKCAADWAFRYRRDHGRCVTCDELALERGVGTRMIEETPEFCALVPFAAGVPFEVWFVPKRHQASFNEIDEAELADLGMLLRRTLQRLERLHGDLPYNFVVDSAWTGELDAPHLHWRLRLVPNLVNWGGFELGTRMPINPSSPEEDAAVLRPVGLQYPLNTVVGR